MVVPERKYESKHTGQEDESSMGNMNGTNQVTRRHLFGAGTVGLAAAAAGYNFATGVEGLGKAKSPPDDGKNPNVTPLAQDYVVVSHRPDASYYL